MFYIWINRLELTYHTLYGDSRFNVFEQSHFFIPCYNEFKDRRTLFIRLNTGCSLRCTSTITIKTILI